MDVLKRNRKNTSFNQQMFMNTDLWKRTSQVHAHWLKSNVENSLGLAIRSDKLTTIHCQASTSMDSTWQDKAG